MASTKVTARAFGDLARHAEKIKNDQHQSVGVMSAGDAWAQGDLLLVMIPGVPAGCEKIAHPSAQLAPGSTQGSRHRLASLTGLTLYRRTNGTVLDGPVVEAPAGCRVNHPEHGDVTLPPGVYAVVYQRAYAAELRRVQD